MAKVNINKLVILIASDVYASILYRRAFIRRHGIRR